MTTHPVIGGAKDTILGTYQQVSAAAAKAVFQLVCTPFYWEKTSHGLDDQPAPVNEQAAA